MSAIGFSEFTGTCKRSYGKITAKEQTVLLDFNTKSLKNLQATVRLYCSLPLISLSNPLSTQWARMSVMLFFLIRYEAVLVKNLSNKTDYMCGYLLQLQDTRVLKQGNYNDLSVQNVRRRAALHSMNRKRKVWKGCR